LVRLDIYVSSRSLQNSPRYEWIGLRDRNSPKTVSFWFAPWVPPLAVNNSEELGKIGWNCLIWASVPIPRMRMIGLQPVAVFDRSTEGMGGHPSGPLTISLKHQFLHTTSTWMALPGLAGIWSAIELRLTVRKHFSGPILGHLRYFMILSHVVMPRLGFFPSHSVGQSVPLLVLCEVLNLS
jgi:hypothetical protein